jgi:hypothetical protein
MCTRIGAVDVDAPKSVVNPHVVLIHDETAWNSVSLYYLCCHDPNHLFMPL